MRRSKQTFARNGFSISGMPAAACSCDKRDALIALGNALLILLQNDQDDDAYAHEDSKCGLTPIPPLGLPHGEPLGPDDHESDEVQGQRDAEAPQGKVFALMENVGVRVSSLEHLVGSCQTKCPGHTFHGDDEPIGGVMEWRRRNRPPSQGAFGKGSVHGQNVLNEGKVGIVVHQIIQARQSR
jgi:hypothetical protein